MEKPHKHEYLPDTREWAKQPGGKGFLCRVCGFRIPANLEKVARASGALFPAPKRKG